MTDEDAPVPMTREQMYKGILVWFGVYKENLRPDLGSIHQEQLAESLTNHLVNGALQLQVAEKEARMSDCHQLTASA